MCGNGSQTGTAATRLAIKPIHSIQLTDRIERYGAVPGTSLREVGAYPSVAGSCQTKRATGSGSGALGNYIDIRCQSGCIVYAVANDCYPFAARRKLLHRCCLVDGENLGSDLIDSGAPGDRIGNRFPIASRSRLAPIHRRPKSWIAVLWCGHKRKKFRCDTASLSPVTLMPAATCCGCARAKAGKDR